METLLFWKRRPIKKAIEEIEKQKKIKIVKIILLDKDTIWDRKNENLLEMVKK